MTAGNSRKKGHFHAVLTTAGVWTVQFAVSSSSDDLVPNAVAKVQWNVDGNPIVRMMSLLDGVSITGVSDSVSVDVFDETTYLYETPNGFDYTVSALIAPGPRAGANNPPTYFPPNPDVNSYPGRFSLPFGTTESIPIPKDAGLTSVNVTVSVYGDPEILTEADVAVRFRSFAGVLLKQWDPRFVDWVPIPPASHTLELVNNHASAMLIFGVSLGVDG
jgi:hypothetical protein